MRPSGIRLAKHVHNVLIRFPDRRLPKTAHVPHPHPSAPKEIQEAFGEFLKKIEASSIRPADQPGSISRAASRDAGRNFWEEGASKYWNPIPVEEWEIEAIESGGAVMPSRKN
ncbi:uncharacterized protein EI90DRAFT_3049084 [Cantharellus anzutake]|uniref:uncharacterized protein n=1 Tax=Cantharellus anzutake TaxID=1750568 RepID=UPI00190329CB|nr:uncharacterized protein EI90DRAFT_3049084 [Cantharellus anzutake]KAF8334970.1 hypothetical protein EI90DRAFT_3049084 [Cantharellus anzutake]